MTKLSIAIIVRDRQKELFHCLQSVRGADEIIVLDTGSTDRTPDVARANGAVVYYYHWEDDFSAARNKVLEYVHNSWVLSIDSDEILKSGIQSVYTYINRNPGYKVVGTKMEQPDGWSFYAGRLFRKDFVHWERQIHEELSKPADALTDEIIIKHNPSPDHKYNPDLNIRMLRSALERNPLSHMDAFFLAEELFNSENYDAAVYWLDTFIGLTPKMPHLTSEAYYLLGECYCKLHRVGKGIDAMINAVKANQQMKVAYERLYDLTKNEKWNELAQTATNHNVLKKR